MSQLTLNNGDTLLLLLIIIIIMWSEILNLMSWEIILLIFVHTNVDILSIYGGRFTVERGESVTFRGTFVQSRQATLQGDLYMLEDV